MDAPCWLSWLDTRLIATRRWQTLALLGYRSVLADREFWIAPGFITDLASVPRLPFVYLLTGDRAPGPAVLHDYFYQHPGWDDRALADGIFHEAMGVEQPDLGFSAESAWVRSLMWSGVRVGGWVAWGKREARVADLNPEMDLWGRAGEPPEAP